MNAFGSSDSDQIATPAYQDILTTVFNHVLNTADVDHNDKVGSRKSKLITRFENFHHLFNQMEAREIPALTELTRQAKTLYEDALNSYIRELAHDILHHLFEFFEGVDKLYRSLREDQHETIQYEDGFTNKVLAKLINKYPISIVEKGLYKEYKKLHYNLSREEGLLPTVWDKFKEFLLAKYKYFEFLMTVCYKNQRLSFKVADLEDTFTSVETRHFRKYGKEGFVAEEDSDSSLDSPKDSGESRDSESQKEYSASESSSKLSGSKSKGSSSFSTLARFKTKKKSKDKDA